MSKDDKSRKADAEPGKAPTPGNRGYKRPPVDDPPPRKPGKPNSASPVLPFRDDEAFGDDDPFSELRPSTQKNAKAVKPVKKAPAPTYNFKPERPRKGLSTYDWISIVFLLLTVGMVAIGLTIFFNPYSSWNPLPPPTPLPLVVTATPMAPQAQAPIIVPTATFTPLPPEMLTQLAPAVDATAETTS